MRVPQLILGVAVLAGMLAGALRVAAQAPTLTSITVAPATLTLDTGNSQQFTATGTYSNGGVQDLTQSVTWTSSNPAVVAVTGTGVGLGMLPGSAVLRAESGTAAGSSAITVVNTNLAGWWPFDESAGSAAADVSGHNHAASLVNGPLWSPGAIGNAVSANGVNQYGNTPPVDLSATRAVTWMAWIYRNYGSDATTLLESTPNFNASTTGFGFFPDDTHDCGDPGKILTGVHGDVGYTLSCYTQPSSGTWHHIAVVYDKAQTGSSVISLYLDGVLQTPTSQPYTATNTNGFGNNPLYLFARGGTERFASGAIDDLRVYSQALPAAQIREIFEQSLGKLLSITVAPADAQLDQGAVLQFRATGVYSTGASHDLTGVVTWTSTAPSLAAITSAGVATALAAGSAGIQATLGSVVGSTSLTVTAGASVRSIVLAPANFSLGIGGTEQLTATGNYSDGSLRDLTATALWSSVNPAVALVGPSGLVTGMAAGSGAIQASYAGITGLAQLSVALPSSLMGWWQFDEGEGSVARDSSGQGASATLYNGPAWVPGPTGTAMAADGSNQYGFIPSLQLGSPQAITWSAWVNRSYGNAKGVLLESSPNFNASTTGFGFFPDDGADCGSTAAMMVGLHGDVGYTVSCYAQPSSGIWHHLAVVLDKSQPGSEAITLYIDGAVQTPLSRPYTATNTNGFGDDPLYLFSRGGTENFLRAELDDLRIYNQALTAAQIQQGYQEGLGALASITVAPPSSSIGAGQTLQYTAIGTYTSGSAREVTDGVVWSSTNPAVASVTSTGMATGVMAGSTTLRATSGAVIGTATLVVTGSLTLQSIAVSPGSFSIPAHATQQLVATGTYSNGTTQDLTTAVTWTTADPQIATVSAAGLASGVSAGTVTLRASLNGITGSATATVTSASALLGWWPFDEGTGSTAADHSGFGRTATLQNGAGWTSGETRSAVVATGSNQYVSIPSVDLSATQAITWMAWVNRTYGSATGVLLEDSANFNASSTGFGFFPDDGPDCGSAAAMMTGVHGDVGYTINCYAQPSSGAWHHLAVVLDKSQVGARVIALYVDGVLQSPLSQPYTATNTNGFGNNPVYLFARGGISNFGAGQVGDLRLYDQALTAAQIQEIYQSGLGTLSSLSVAPGAASLGVGQTLQYTATGHYSDGASLDLTGSATWSSSSPGVAPISGTGLATALAIGDTTIQAHVGAITGNAGLTVTAAPILRTLSVTPANLSLAPGATQQMTATGIYSDGSSQDLTAQVTWSSSTPAAAVISSTGLLTAVAPGSTLVLAALPSTTGQTTVTIGAGAAQMVQWASGDGGSTETETTYQYQNATPGNLVFVMAHWDNIAATATVKDQLGNTYAPVVPATNTGPADRCQLWYAKNIRGGIPLAVTLTFSARTTAFSVVDVVEYSGFDPVAPLDVWASATGYGNAQDSGDLTTTSGNETIVGFFGYAGYPGPFLAGAGFTFRNYDASTMLEDRAVSTAGVYRATASSASPSYWAAFALAMRHQAH